MKNAIADRTNETKYDVEYRLKMLDGSYQWFRANAEIVRRTDGTAHRITGIFVNIDTAKKAAMQQRKAEVFHNAFTKTNLCEYYVNLKENTFDSMKVESSMMDIFDSSDTWDDLIKAMVDNYICEEYKQEVRQFYQSNQNPARQTWKAPDCCNDCKCICRGCADGKEYRNGWSYCNNIGFWDFKQNLKQVSP